ncbi:MAG: SDR family oxidoreductase [Clostridiales Family XIII bacterium]|jgi:gluconate 5-dehydrogenase|nr:SDR family oxidoreductase [Clostridiales Family XIII bacterium]
MIKSIETMKGAFDLSGRKALVTGGGRGLGATIAVALAESGADVAIADLYEAADTVSQIQSYGVKSKSYLADISSFADVTQLTEDVYADFGQIDILINNAGISAVGDFLDDENLENWTRVLGVNLQGTAIVTHAVGNRMRALGAGGCIINISSIASGTVVRTQNMACYCASKAAINSLTRTTAYELGKYDIRVNAIAVGFFNSELSKMIPEGQIPYLEDTIVLGRFGEPIELGALSVYLASPAAAMITGAVIPINGGQDLSL